MSIDMVPDCATCHHNMILHDFVEDGIKCTVYDCPCSEVLPKCEDCGHRAFYHDYGTLRCRLCHKTGKHCPTLTA